MARTFRARDSTALWWTLAGIVASIMVTALVVVAPLVAVLLISACLYLWTFLWKVELFFAVHFAIAFIALITVPILRLTAAENNLRFVVAALLVATAIAVAIRVKVAPPGALVALSALFFILGGGNSHSICSRCGQAKCLADCSKDSHSGHRGGGCSRSI